VVRAFVSKYFINLLTFFQIILLNRLRNDAGYDCLLCVDGTDFKIGGFNKCNFSPKFRASGLRWEVAICIMTYD
jgi:hypothetical protein